MTPMHPILAILALTATLLTANPFFENHCLDCHDSDLKKGGIDLSTLDSSKLDDLKILDLWVKVHDRVRDGEMPPKKKDRPPADALAAFLAPLNETLTATTAAQQAATGRAAIRRLNRFEFENSLRDLLALPGLRIAHTLPADGKAHGFDRLAAALDTSFVHLETYLAAIDTALDAALCPSPEQPPVFKYRYNPLHNLRKNGKECEGDVALAIGNKTGIGLAGMTRDETLYPDWSHHLTDDPPHSTAFGLFRHEDADYRLKLTHLLPVLSGKHKLRLRGYSFGWDGKKVVSTERHGAVTWGIFATGEQFGTVDLPPNAAAEREVTAYLERGKGLSHGTDDWLRLIGSSLENFRDYAHGENANVTGPMSPAPGIAIEWVELEGPIHEQWPPASHVALFGDLPVKLWSPETRTPKPLQQKWERGNPDTFPKDIYGHRNEQQPVVFVESTDPKADAARLLKIFLPKAFRRPVTSAEHAEYLALFAEHFAIGPAFQDALIATYRAALSSPEFMLLREPVGPLDDHSLAVRLAYFLWSGPPDATLTTLADRGQLARPAVLREQVERLLNDPRSARFTENFLGGWLDLRKIGDTQPDRVLYPEFMPWLQEAAVLESHAYFDELVRENLPVTHLVTSDFAMLNEPLARLYGIDGVRGWDIRKVSLPPGSPRGGFLTQASILKTTAAGTTTSPVKRGVFVMEKILGIHPTPPPPAVGSIEPDVRGATTIREQLDKHRASRTCAACHAKIDGYGFALEAFDVVGEHRTRYRAMGYRDENAEKRVNGHTVQYYFGPAVNPSGEMPDGTPFSDVNELRAHLAARPQILATAFATHLATYATGAEISFADRAAIQSIVNATASSGHGFRDLIHAIVQSDLFRRR